MHILFLHQNFPAQFGQIAAYLARNHGFRCTFVSENQVPDSPEIQNVAYGPYLGSTPESNNYSRTLELQVRQSSAAFAALHRRPELRPNIIVAHSGFVSSLLLRELYPETPQINYFEFFYHKYGSDMDFRLDLPKPSEDDFLRLRYKNAQLLLDLHNCDAGYSPTEFQRSQLPVEFQSKVSTIFDGIDTDFWSPSTHSQRAFGGVTIPDDHKVITYVSRGLEATRGFDIFLRAADQVCRQRNDVSVIVVAEDRVAYGGDCRFTNGMSFKEWVIDKYKPNLSRIHFVGRLPPSQLSKLLALSDVHVYLTVPFVLSWSLFNALSCGALTAASDTAPVRELIRHGETGFLFNFFDIDGLTELVLRLLSDPSRHQAIRHAARSLILSKYDLKVTLPKMLELYREVSKQAFGLR